MTDAIMPAREIRFCIEKGLEASFDLPVPTEPGVGHVPMTDNPGLVASILLAGSESPATV